MAIVTWTKKLKKKEPQMTNNNQNTIKKKDKAAKRLHFAAVKHKAASLQQPFFDDLFQWSWCNISYFEMFKAVSPALFIISSKVLKITFAIIICFLSCIL